jgi:membrane protease YdiL (CAAX protease family)
MLQWTQSRYETAPVTTAAVAYLVLATVRISGAYSIPLMVLSIALTPIVIFAVPRDAWFDMGMRRSHSHRMLGVAVVVVLASYAASVVASFTAFGSGDDNWLSWIPKLFAQLVPHPVALRVVVMLACLVVLVPLVEEVCYRGVLFDASAQRVGPVGAVVVTSLLWASVHLGDYGLNPYNPKVIIGSLFSVLVMGFGLGICRLLTGSVVACIIGQGTANLALCGTLLFHVPTAPYGW